MEAGSVFGGHLLGDDLLVEAAAHAPAVLSEGAVHVTPATFHHKAFRAYFADGKNLALHEVLLDLAKDSGLSREEALSVLENRTFSDAVDGDWEMSRRMGITAVPTFHYNGSLLVGAQQYTALSQFVSPGAEPPRRNLF